jgi:hypothetical protein
MANSKPSKSQLHQACEVATVPNTPEVKSPHFLMPLLLMSRGHTKEAFGGLFLIHIPFS